MLQLTQTTQSGVTVQDAIHKVINAQTIPSGETSFFVGIFVNQTIGIPVEARGYTFMADVNGGEIFDQCYEYLKTLPEYAGAIDV